MTGVLLHLSRDGGGGVSVGSLRSSMSNMIRIRKVIHDNILKEGSGNESFRSLKKLHSIRSKR